MSGVEKGVVIPLGSSGDFDDAAVNFPSHIARNGQHYIFHEGNLNSDSTIRIGLTITKDSIDMVKKGVVIPQNTGDYNSTYSRTPFVLDINGKIYMLLTGSVGGVYRMALAISDDGFNLAEKGVVIPLGDSGDSDDTRVIQCTIIPLNGRYYIYYSASSDGAVTYQTNLAIASDFINVTKKGVVMPLGSSGAPDDVWRAHPYVEYVNGMFYMYTIAKDGTDKRIMLSTSKDGLNFTDKGVHEPLGISGNADEEWVNAFVPFEQNGKVYGYKVPVGYTTTKRVGMVISDGRMSSPRPARPLIDDAACVLYWDGKEVLSKIRMEDESGQGNHATLNGPTWVSGGLKFDGSNDRAVIPYDSSMDVLDGNTAWTFMMGVKFAVLPSVKAANEVLFSQADGDVGGMGRNWVQVNSTDDKIRSALDGVWTISTKVVSIDTWYFVVLTYDGTNLKIYVDDDLVATNAITPAENANGSYVTGSKKTEDGTWFDGTKDVIKLFGEELSASKRTEAYDWWRARL